MVNKMNDQTFSAECLWFCVHANVHSILKRNSHLNGRNNSYVVIERIAMPFLLTAADLGYMQMFT